MFKVMGGSLMSLWVIVWQATITEIISALVRIILPF